MCLVLKLSSVKCTMIVFGAPVRGVACEVGTAGASIRLVESLRGAEGANDGPIIGLRKVRAGAGGGLGTGSDGVGVTEAGVGADSWAAVASRLYDGVSCSFSANSRSEASTRANSSHGFSRDRARIPRLLFEAKSVIAFALVKAGNS